jgi:hypothetical protein
MSPGFPAALGNFMRLSSQKAAHVTLSYAACGKSVRRSAQDDVFVGVGDAKTGAPSRIYIGCQMS